LQPVSEAHWLASANKTQNKIPPTNEEAMQRNETSTIGRGDGTAWSAEEEKILLGPYEYMLEQPGKNIREQLIDAFNQILQLPAESLKIIKEVIKKLHTASLL
jgi:geranylgeranyl diphosphate synthase type 3